MKNRTEDDIVTDFFYDENIVKILNRYPWFPISITTDVLNILDEDVIGYKLLGREVSSNNNLVNSETDFVMDLFLTDYRIIRVIIEANFYNTLLGINKNLTYVHQSAIRDITNREKYDKLANVHLINLNRKSIHKDDNFVTKVTRGVLDNLKKEYKNFPKIFNISLEKLSEENYNVIKEEGTRLQKRLYFLVHRFNSMEEMKDFYEGDDEMIGMVSDMENHVGIFDEILKYDRKKFNIEMGREVGRDEGISIGRNEGISIGRDEGISIGRDEGMLLAARNFLANGASDELILNSTNITEDQLQELKNEINR